MNKSIWRLISLLVWILGLIAFLIMLTQLKENYMEYLSRGYENGEIRYLTPALIIVIVVGVMYLAFISYIAYTIWKKKTSTVKLLILSTALLTVKFSVQAYLKVIVGEDLIGTNDMIRQVYFLFRDLDTNNNFIYMFRPNNNYFAQSSLLATEVIPISFMFLGLFLGWMNREYFVVISVITVLLMLFIAFGTKEFNHAYFDLPGVYSTMTIAFMILSYSLNCMYTSEKVKGVAL